jgi:hypothetical protein
VELALVVDSPPAESRYIFAQTLPHKEILLC